MKKLIIFLAAIASFFVMLSSCKNTEQGKGGIIFDSIVVQENINLFEVNDTTLPHAEVSINFTYPTKFRNEEDLSTLQSIFIATFFSNDYIDEFSPKELVDMFLIAYKEEYQDLSNSYEVEVEQLEEGSSLPMWYWYSLNLSNNILYESDALLSYAVHHSDYTGGAHGSYNVSYINVNLEDFTIISEEDLFVPDYENKLAEIIVNRLMIENDISERDDLYETGFFNVDEIFPNSNFWLDNEGIHYAFNQYEIAPYAMGVIEVNIPFEDLTEILISDTSISKFLTNKE